MGKPRPYHPLCDWTYQEGCGCVVTFHPPEGHLYRRTIFCWHHEGMRERWRDGLWERAKAALEKVKSEYRK